VSTQDVEQVMTTTLADMAAIQQAIRQLPRTQREELAEWILNSGDFSPFIAEPKLPWGAADRLLSVDEYLQVESDSALRHEYVAGALFTVPSPVIRHEVIVANVLSNFHVQLRGGPCKVFSSNARVRLRFDHNDLVYLPDVTVACGPFGEDALDFGYIMSPAIIVEVASPVTEVTDRREKALLYRCIPSLEEYVLIAQRSLHVTIFRRGNDWKPTVLTDARDTVEFHSVEANMTLADVYEGTR
jgi:Uma2 family endonuclease